MQNSDWLTCNKAQVIRLLEQQSLYDDLTLLTFNASDKFCEIGCGVGANLWLAKKLSRGTYFGVDTEVKFLQDCLQKTKQNAIKNAYFLCAEDQDLPLKSNSMDVVFCHLLLIRFVNPENILQEMTRVLRSFGTLIAIEPDITAYKTNKPALLKCFQAYTQFMYGKGQGSIEIARHLPQLLADFTFSDIKAIPHEISADHSDLTKVHQLLSNWYQITNNIAQQLMDANWLTENDLKIAEKELSDIKEEDFVYQRLWFISGKKIED